MLLDPRSAHDIKCHCKQYEKIPKRRIQGGKRSDRCRREWKEQEGRRYSYRNHTELRHGVRLLLLLFVLLLLLEEGRYL